MHTVTSPNITVRQDFMVHLGASVCMLVGQKQVRFFFFFQQNVSANTEHEVEHEQDTVETAQWWKWEGGAELQCDGKKNSTDLLFSSCLLYLWAGCLLACYPANKLWLLFPCWLSEGHANKGTNTHACADTVVFSIPSRINVKMGSRRSDLPC